MATLTIRKTPIVVVTLMCTLFILNGCNGGKGMQLGEKIPAGTSVTKLADIIEKPTDFNGKTVLIHGSIVGQCASLCEFFFKEGVHEVTIYPQGYKFPKLETGKKVAVYALVTSGEENVAFSALGISIE